MRRSKPERRLGEVLTQRGGLDQEGGLYKRPGVRPGFVWLVILNHPLGPSITNQINPVSRNIYFPECSIYTSLQKYASNPFNT